MRLLSLSGLPPSIGCAHLLEFKMKIACNLLRLLIACVCSAWVFLLGLGINFWQVGIQQQIDGTRLENSFPYEAFGQSCIQWAAIWGFVSLLGLSFWSMYRRRHQG